MTTGESGYPFAEGGSYPVREGNLVRPLVDGVPAFRRICQAIEAAEHSVWGTVTFAWDAFRAPDGRGSIFDVLDRAVARGLDVRVIFWRHDEGVPEPPNLFWGSPDQQAMLGARGSRIAIRWDPAAVGFCQHQKSWLVDAGQEGEAAFVGGINLNPHSVVVPGHPGDGPQNHDVYVELAGPCATDVHHNFVQRWNEASERVVADGAWGTAGDLAFPVRASPPRGGSRGQIQRTIRKGLYSDGQATPGGAAFDIAAGERSVFEQYLAAIGAARRTLYLENQYLEVPAIVAALDAALARGVQVVAVVPGQPDLPPRLTAPSPERLAFLDSRRALGRHAAFTLAGLAGLGTDGTRSDVYVHAKLMLADDAWATIGSANLHFYSQFGNSEMNLSFQDPAVVRALRAELFAEHLGQDTGALDDCAALAAFHRIARENHARRAAGDPAWQGLAFQLDPETYGW